MKCNLVEYEKPELHFRSSSTSDLTHTIKQQQQQQQQQNK